MKDLIKTKNEVFVPEENITVSFAVTEDKPFNKCFKCHSFRNGCSGPNPLVMGFERACEFLQLTRIFIGWTYQQVADATVKIGMALSLATVKRTLTGKNSDPSFFTMSALTIVLVGDPNGKYPCAIPNVVNVEASEVQLNDALRELERALADNADYRAALDNIHISYKTEIDAVRSDDQKKIDYLLASNERLRTERDKWRAESESWRSENERKNKIIDTITDTYIDKLIPQGENEK